MPAFNQRTRLRTSISSFGLCAIVLALGCPAYAADTTPFLYAIAGYTDSSNKDHSIEGIATTGEVVAESPGIAARTSFGSIGYKYGTTPENTPSWPFGIFSDRFTVSGSTGTGVLNISATIHGSASGYWDQGFSLFVSSDPFGLQSVLDQWNLQAAGCPPDTGCDYDVQFAGATRVLNRIVNNGGATADATLTGSIAFHYGTPFYALAFLGGDGHSAVDFYNSATLGLSGPSGSSLNAQSGSIYAAAIPEPAVGSLMLVGIITLFTYLKRKKSTSVPASLLGS